MIKFFFKFYLFIAKQITKINNNIGIRIDKQMYIM